MPLEAIITFLDGRVDSVDPLYDVILEGAHLYHFEPSEIATIVIREMPVREK